MLRVLDHVFYQRLSKEAILPPADIKNIFTNLDEILQLHGTHTTNTHALKSIKCCSLCVLVFEQLRNSKTLYVMRLDIVKFTVK